MVLVLLPLATITCEGKQAAFEKQSHAASSAGQFFDITCQKEALKNMLRVVLSYALPGNEGESYKILPCPLPTAWHIMDLLGALEVDMSSWTVVQAKVVDGGLQGLSRSDSCSQGVPDGCLGAAIQSFRVVLCVFLFACFSATLLLAFAEL